MLRKATASIAVLFAFGALPVVYAKEELGGNSLQDFAKYREAAWAHFQKRCKGNAKEAVYRMITNVEGVFLLKPREEPSEANLRDQYWMGDPYGLILYPPAEILRYLSDLNENDISTTRRTSRRGFSYVETPNSGGSDFLVHRLSSRRDKIVTEVSGVRMSRYAVIREDISTKDDRYYWVAGGRLAVTDLSSGEVLGERIGYVLEAGFGSTSGARRPWLFAQDFACPPIRRNVASDRLFIQKVLKPTIGDVDGK